MIGKLFSWLLFAIITLAVGILFLELINRFLGITILDYRKIIDSLITEIKLNL